MAGAFDLADRIRAARTQKPVHAFVADHALSAAYALWLYRRVVFGALTKDNLKLIKDMRANEIAAFAPLVVLTLLMGIYPSLFLDPMAASVDHLVSQITDTGTTSQTTAFSLIAPH